MGNSYALVFPCFHYTSIHCTGCPVFIHSSQPFSYFAQTARSLGVVPLGDPGIEMLLETASLPKRTYLEFFASGWSPSGDVGTTSPSVVEATGTLSSRSTLPLRFADPQTRRHNPRAQHPVYQTSNNYYGLKKAGIVDMPDTYASSSQFFTNTFFGGPAKVSCMNTAISKSKVHNELNEY